MRIAIVGSGIAGITASCLLEGAHEVTIFESESRLGGHAHTVDVALGDKNFRVDTGFIVYNEATYPNFIKLLERFKVATQWSDMSFSVQAPSAGLEYASQGLGAFFAQRSNAVRPVHWRLLAEIFRFNKLARRFLSRGGSNATLREFLEVNNFSEYFRDYYVTPLLAAIWSAAPGEVGDYPAGYFLNFFLNHGLLEVKTGPRWRVVQGGSGTYVDAFTRHYRDRVRLATPVQSILRERDGVLVQPQQGEPERFDHVVLAVHSDVALGMLADPSDAETEILSAIAYRDNDVVLHTDTSLMPRQARAWASWNYYLPESGAEQATLTYDMNRLQGIEASTRFLVSLNSSHRIDPTKVLGRYRYAHPVYTAKGIEAQGRHAEISGQRRTHYCGAYWGYGFHEDGVKSGLAVGAFFDRKLADV